MEREKNESASCAQPFTASESHKSKERAMSPIQGILEVLDDQLYDTVHTMAPRVNRGHRELMFVVPLGQVMQTNEGPRVKQELETNMWESGMLSTSGEFVVRALRCAFIGRKILPASSRFYADTTIRLVINRKFYLGGLAWKFADPVTLVLNADTLLAMGRHARVDLVRSLRRTIEPKICIRQQESFAVEVHFAGQSWQEYSEDAPDRFVVLLEGKRLVAIQ